MKPNKYLKTILFKTPYDKFCHKLNVDFLLGSTLSGNDLPGESSMAQFKPRVMKFSLNKEEAELIYKLTRISFF